jgi:hypothetical protein
MDSGQIIYIICRLILGAAAAFLAIMLWSKTKDPAWMFMVVGAIATYGETVYSILGIFWGNNLGNSSMSLTSIVLPCLPLMFFITGFAVMVVRKYRNS